jgi:hypothetical protein
MLSLSKHGAGFFNGLLTHRGRLPVHILFTNHFDSPATHATYMLSMTRRLGIMLLLAAVSLSGAATCPRGVMACAMLQQATHDCCKHRTSLRSNDCCCKAAHQLTSRVVSTTPQSDNVPVKLVATPLHPALRPTDTIGDRIAGQPLGHGVAPPDTPITQHILLLL